MNWLADPEPGMPDPLVEYHDDGETIKSVIYVNQLGQHHRTDGPASHTWHANGVKAFEGWYVDGVAIIPVSDDPTYRTWYEDGTRWYESWQPGGKYHRDHGPAQMVWDRAGNLTIREYYKRGIVYSKSYP